MKTQKEPKIKEVMLREDMEEPQNPKHCAIRKSIKKYRAKEKK